MSTGDALALTPSTTFGGYRIWDEGWEEKFDAADPYAMQWWVCNGTDSTAIASLLGGGYDPGAGAYLQPHAFSRAPWLFCKGIQIKGIPVDGMTHDNTLNLAAYKYHRLAIRYGRYMIDPGNINEGDIQLTFRDEVDIPSSYDVDGNAKSVWQFPDSTKVDPANRLPVHIPAGTVRIVRENCSTNASALQQSLMGKVNAASLYGYAAETLYFGGACSSKKITLAGSNNWTNTFDLQWRSIGWNTYFNPSATGSNMLALYQKVTLISDGTSTPFQLGDFSAFRGFL